jgi:uncharacterized RDD family membrane protein YckC
MTDPPRRTPASRLLGAGAKAGERVAALTGVDQAMEDALEEAIVRALRSPAVERAVVRLIERNAVQDALGRALAQDELADAIVRALESEVADRVWADLLASRKAQMLVERIAEAPEVRAAITQQGAGLITDVGRRLTVLTEALDDAFELAVHRLLRRPGHEEETNEVGLLTRALAAAVDLGLVSAAYSVVSGLIASVIPVIFGLDPGERLPLWAGVVLAVMGFFIAGSIIVAFWSLVGQTPGMRFLSIRLDVDGSAEVGLGRAIKRLFALPISLIPLGMGFFAILVSPTRRGWHDHIAGTKVVYDRHRAVAPHSQKPSE